MKVAVESGDAKKVAEMIRQDPGFNVNMVDGDRGPYCTTLAIAKETVDPP